MITFTDFIDELYNLLKVQLGEKMLIEVVTVPKNNGVFLKGITIRKQGEQIAPTIYLEGYYSDFTKGRKMQDIMDDIQFLYEAKNRIEIPDVSFMNSYDTVKDKIVYKLVSREKNEELLQEMPYKEFLNFAIVFYCQIYAGEGETATVTIKTTHMEKWGVTVDRMWEDAKHNTHMLLPVKERQMFDVIRELMKEQYMDRAKQRDGMLKKEDGDPNIKDVERYIDRLVEEELWQMCSWQDMPLIVLTNESKMYGASVILYDHVLEEIAGRQGGDLYILPSSVHEVILVPKRAENAPERLLDMVKEVNATQLEPEEILTDSVYYFDREKNQISIFAE